jgi:integrase
MTMSQRSSPPPRNTTARWSSRWSERDCASAKPAGCKSTTSTFSGAPLRIRQQRRPGGELGPLKTGSSRREISADDAVLGALAEQFRRWPGRDGLVFSSSSGRPLTKAIAGYEFDAIERTVGFTVSPHSLRRYFGASLVSRGVSVVAVSRWLGHSSPEITYRVYAYRKPDDEQAARDATAKTMRQLVPHVYPMCTEKGAE